MIKIDEFSLSYNGSLSKSEQVQFNTFGFTILFQAITTTIPIIFSNTLEKVNNFGNVLNANNSFFSSIEKKNKINNVING